MSCVKQLVEEGCLTSVPSHYVFQRNPDEDRVVDIDREPQTMPVIDFSQLTSGIPDQRLKAIKDIGDACQEWGFFMVINHGVPSTLRDEVIRATESFFDLTTEEKQQYAGKELSDPIRYGTSFNNFAIGKALLWRDYLKIHVHPHFSAPRHPSDFSEILHEFCKSTREVASELLKGISKSLGMEEGYINEIMEIGEGCHQLLVANMYPPCPQPELVMGLPSHSDHGLLTLLMQNELCGLQVMHDGKWVPINPLPNSFLVNTGDHMEILTNGKYKSVLHRAVVNAKATRISIGTAHGPPLDKIVSPAPDLLALHRQSPAYRGISYRDYLHLQQRVLLNAKSCLDHLRL